MYQYRFNSMSTIVQISISQEMFANDLMPVYKEFERIEETCSRFKKNSELSLLNRQVGMEVTVSNEMFSILSKAGEFYQETGGVFNPGILSSLEAAGYAGSIETIRNQNLRLRDANTTTAVKAVPFSLDAAAQSVMLHQRIDLGGIAKGWVIDQAAALLEKMGYGFINVGGDIRIFGDLPRSLNIGIEDPNDSVRMISSIQVSTGAVATSTSGKRKWLRNGERQHHLIDPRTGKPSSSSIVSATVTAPTALEADIWAKTVLLLDEKEGRNWIVDKGASAVFIMNDGEIWKGGIPNGDV
ncbi:FAD:protein FMN transferase [Neobacillus dielmonensis]|uniref:FAD:protein FMN transferase n=1 Tax=Neobacillus dielmonensis TaxID=1347369 RepID=UPI0005A63528|nr:FAD:protein FMN transferase [Neobacillus dielmonensis]